MIAKSLPSVLLPVLLAAAALPAAAQAPAGPETRVNLVHERSNLSNGLPDWSASTLRLTHLRDQRTTVDADVTQTRRFGLDDTELGLGGSLPVGQPLTLNLRLTASPTHRVLPRHSVAGGAAWEFQPAWLLHGTLKTTRYDSNTVDQGSAMLEHYFGNFSAAAALHTARTLGRTTQAWELRGAWYYGDRSSVGAMASTGDEAVELGPDALGIARVRSVALVGAHDLGGPWMLRWGIHHVRQGGFYTRSGASLGVQYAF